MGSAIHIQSFYDNERILHRERLMMVNGLSVWVKMPRSPFAQRILYFHFYFIYKSSGLEQSCRNDFLVRNWRGVN